MKISFDTPLTGTDQTGATVALTAQEIAALTYTVFVDTVNPPQKSYAVPPSVVANATPNADGSKRVTVDAAQDLGIAVQDNVTYYLGAKDSLGNLVSPETSIVTFTHAVTPAAPGNFQVA